MAEGKLRQEWLLQSAMMAHIANCNPYRDPKAKTFTPANFDPFELAKRKAKPVSTKSTFALIRDKHFR